MKQDRGIGPPREQPTPDLPPGPPGTHVPNCLIRIRDEAIALISPNLNGLFEAFDDVLFERANMARNNTEQNRYFDAMRETRIQRKGIAKRFWQQFTQDFQAPLQPSSCTSPPQSPATESMESKLDLVPEEALEENLALNGMASRSRSKLTGPLHEFQTRVSLGLGRGGPAESSPSHNPLDPEILVQSFARACADVNISLHERLLLYKEFERHVLTLWGEVLDLGNKTLEQAGLPYHRNTQTRTPASIASHGTPDSPREPAVSAAEPAFNKTSRRQAQLLLSLLQSPSQTQAPSQSSQSLLIESYAERPYSQAETRPKTNRHLDHAQLSPQDLQGILTKLQRQIPPAELSKPLPPSHPQEIRRLLTQHSEDQRPLRLNPLDDGLIDLVSMLFEFILSDERLAPPLRGLIGRLQIPILKVVLQDRSFFRDASHPARRLLNDLARAGIGWSDASDRKRDQLFEWIQAVVQRILDEFDGDLALFQELSQQFSATLEREEHKARLIEQRTRQAEEGRIRMERTQALIDRVLTEKIAGRQLPPLVEELLCTGWSRLMFITYLQDDRQQRWHQCLEVIDELLCCLQPSPPDQPPSHRQQRISTLLARLRAGLQEVSHERRQLDRQLRELEHILLRIPSLGEHTDPGGHSRKTPHVHPPEPDVLPDQLDAPLTESHPPQHDKTLAEYRNRIERIPTGTWLEFSLVNGSTFRCKLSARIDGGTRYIFVNRIGLKMIEKNVQELAQELSRDRIRILREEEPLLEGAMRGLVGRLQLLATQTA